MLLRLLPMVVIVVVLRLTRKSRPVVGAQDTGHDDPDPGLPTSKRWKRLLPPVSSGAGGEVGVPQHLFPSPWGWIRFAPGTPGTCLWREGSGAVCIRPFK